MSNVHVCPVHGCESLILPTRLVCHGHLMSLPERDRERLSLMGRFTADSSERLQVAQAEAVAYLNRMQAGRR